MEDEAAAEAANPSMAQETLNEWLNWRERMRAQDRLHADLEEEERRQYLAEQVRKTAYHPDAPQRAADAAKPYDRSDHGGTDRRQRANKTAAALGRGEVTYFPGYGNRWPHDQVGDKPANTSAPPRQVDGMTINVTGSGPHFAPGNTIYQGRVARNRDGFARWVTTKDVTRQTGRRKQ